jgi:hypothetical protein
MGESPMPGRKKPSSLALVDAEDRIVADVLCIRCGRSLRDCLLTQPCPACGHPASDSVHGDYLIHSDPQMVRGLADAAQVVEYGAAVLGSLMIMALLVTLVRADDLAAATCTAYEVVFAAAVMSPIIATVGLLLLTTRHSAAFYWARYGHPRALLRLGLLALVVIAVVATATFFFGRIALQLGTVVWVVALPGAFLRGVEHLMRRVPNNQLAAFARATFVGLMMFGALAIAVALLSYGAAEDPSWEEPRLAFTAINALGGLLLGVAVFRLVVRVRRTLSSIAR